MPTPIIVNGQVGLQTSRSTLVAAGKYFAATNPTPGTAIAYSLKTGYSATANGFWSISNSANSSTNIQLDRLKIVQTATAPTGCLIMRSELYTETGIMAISGAALAVTPVNMNPASSNATGATVTFFSAGAGTVPAAVGTRRLVGVCSLATGVAVTHDSYTFDFGADGQSQGTVGLTAARATDPADLVAWAPPVIVTPGTSAYMNLWWLTQAANTPSFEFELTWAEV